MITKLLLHCQLNTLIKRTALLSVAFFAFYTCPAQSISADRKFAPDSLREDLVFLKTQIFNAHANPFTELSKEKYIQLFHSLESRLTDSLTITDFFKLVKPVVSYLADEHAEIFLPKALTGFQQASVFLPFNLRREKQRYLIDTVLSGPVSVTKGMAVKAVNNIPVEQLLSSCATYVPGPPERRKQKALLQFGYLYALATPLAHTFAVTLQDNRVLTVQGVAISTWQQYLDITNGKPGPCANKISYTKFGETGYVNTCSFDTRSDSDFQLYAKAIDSIFSLVQRDEVKRLLIDVSQNSGGNSAVGSLLIDKFYARPYRSYSVNWKRSDEYLRLIKSWGFEDKNYEQLEPGTVLHGNADTTWPSGSINRFKGKVFVLIGNATFSSAIMFATIIKDNAIAPLVGQTPGNGHPSHFGEMFFAQLPHTRLGVRFGVKEWIRPAGKAAGNMLTPDIVANPEDIPRLITALPR